MTAKHASEQEGSLAELMRDSFGSHFLYVPEKYFRQGQQKEACDLFWFGNGILVLFYMTRGRQSVEKQQRHNVKQINNWLNYWRARDELHLCGTNHYGNRISVTRTEVDRCAAISVIGHESGILFHQTIREKNFQGYCCSIPESVILFIARMSGTAIDLLQTIDLYSREFRRHNRRNSPSSGLRLSRILDRQAEAVAKVRRGAPDSSRPDDLDFIHNVLTKFLDPRDVPIKEEPRRNLSSVFCDMSALDFTKLTITANDLIASTENQTRTMLGRTQGLHTDWTLFATSLAAGNFSQHMEFFFKEIKERRWNEGPLLIFAYVFPGADYRVPFMMALPPPKNLQGTSAIDSVMKRLE